MSISTHVLDTGRGEPARGVTVELFRGDDLVASGETDDDGRIAQLAGDELGPGAYRLVFHPARRSSGASRSRSSSGPATTTSPPPRPLLVRDLPRKLTVQELADLFQARSRFVEALAEVEDPLGRAREVLAGLPEEQRVEALAHHPRIGERKLTGRSAAEQGAPAEEDPEVMAELAELNAAYEERFGFRFVVFVNRRPRAEIVPVLRERLERTRGGARDRLRRARRDRGGPMAELLRIGYGKEAVSVYRTDGVRTLFAAEVGMTARGEAFLPSYTEGDNTVVVATDSMKNFIHMTALEYEASLEGFLELLARRFMDTYPQAARIELTAREVPFARRSEQSFQSVGGDYGVAELALDRDGTLEHRSGREGSG